MKIFGFNISVGREAGAPEKKDAAQYALSAGVWPEEGSAGGEERARRRLAPTSKVTFSECVLYRSVWGSGWYRDR